MPIHQLVQILQNAATATGDGTAFVCEGLAFATFQITGTFVATITFEATIDLTNWVAVQAKNENDGSVATTATAAGLYSFHIAGYRRARARVTWTSGTSITVTAKGTELAPGVSMADVDISDAISTEAKQDVIIGELEAQNSLIQDTYDYIGLTYTGSNLTTVVYKTGGAGGTTVSTLTLAYTGAVLDSVTQS